MLTEREKEINAMWVLYWIPAQPGYLLGVRFLENCHFYLEIGLNFRNGMQIWEHYCWHNAH